MVSSVTAFFNFPGLIWFFDGFVLWEEGSLVSMAVSLVQSNLTHFFWLKLELRYP